MSHLMRCLYCGLLQDEPRGVKACARCGGELVFEQPPPTRSYVQAQIELDQINAPADQIVDRHLVLTIQTPPQVPDDEAAPTESGREPMTFTAVLDVSGSMRRDKLDAAKEAKDAISMRNRLTHGYFDVNLDVVWETIQTDIPDLIKILKKIIVTQREDRQPDSRQQRRTWQGVDP